MPNSASQKGLRLHGIVKHSAKPNIATSPNTVVRALSPDLTLKNLILVPTAALAHYAQNPCFSPISFPA
jgi:hypothetical protein